MGSYDFDFFEFGFHFTEVDVDTHGRGYEDHVGAGHKGHRDGLSRSNVTSASS